MAASSGIASLLSGVLLAGDPRYTHMKRPDDPPRELRPAFLQNEYRGDTSDRKILS